MGAGQISFLLLVGIACMIPGIAAGQGPDFYYNHTNFVDVECYLADFVKEHWNVDKRALKVVQIFSCQNTTVAYLDLVNWVNRTAETQFVGRVLSLDSQKNSWLKLTLMDVKVNTDESLSYTCVVEYDEQVWFSPSISFKPAGVSGTKVKKDKGITVAVHAALSFDCLYSTTSTVSSGKLTIEHYHSDTEARERVCPNKRDEGIHGASQIRCKISPDGDPPTDKFGLQAYILNPNCSNEGTYRCIFSINSQERTSAVHISVCSSNATANQTACACDDNAPYKIPFWILLVVVVVGLIVYFRQQIRARCESLISHLRNLVRGNSDAQHAKKDDDDKREDENKHLDPLRRVPEGAKKDDVDDEGEEGENDPLHPSCPCAEGDSAGMDSHPSASAAAEVPSHERIVDQSDVCELGLGSRSETGV